MKPSLSSQLCKYKTNRKNRLKGNKQFSLDSEIMGGFFSPSLVFLSSNFLVNYCILILQAEKSCLVSFLTDILSHLPGFFAHKSPSQPEKSQVPWISKCSKQFSIFTSSRLPSSNYTKTTTIKSFLLPTEIQSFKFCQSFSSGIFPSYFLY